MDRRRSASNYLSLRDAMNRLFESSYITPQMYGEQTFFPTLNLHATDDDVVAEIAVPGAKPDSINISVAGDTVSVSGEIKGSQRRERGQTYIQENWEGQFQRSFTIPYQVDSDAATATFENGILTLTLPKADAIKPRKIQVTSGQSGQAGSSVERETVPVRSGDGQS
ncbi:MAG TPA: Hsp20/alpha crystallin family protein [Chloroflexota bacterium]